MTLSNESTGETLSSTLSGMAKPPPPKIYLREHRLKRKITLNQLYELVERFEGSTPTNMSKAERGAQPYSPALIERIAGVYGIHVTALFSPPPGEGEPDPPPVDDDTEQKRIFAWIKEQMAKEGRNRS